MSVSPLHRDLHGLVDSLIDDRCDDRSLAELNKRLEEEPDFRRQYIHCMCMEAEMRAMHAADVQEPQPCVATLSIAADPAPVRRWSQSLMLAVSFAAVAAGTAWLTSAYFQPGNQLANSSPGLSSPNDNPTGTSGYRDEVARITGTRDCRWSKSNSDTSFGAPLASGQQLDLVQGLAEITFDSGARVVLEGPSSFVVPGETSGELLAGRMAAAIPRGAVGFTIRTPSVSISDCGTQYGLVADANGETEVHVFEGPVIARAVDSQGRETNQVQMIATEAVRITPVSGSFAMFRADGNKFVRTLTPSSGPTEGLLAFEAFDYPVGPLAWQNGGFGWAGPWADLEAPEDANAQEGALTNGVSEGSLAGCELISIGNRAALTAQQNRIRRNLSTSLRGVFDTAGCVEIQDGVRLIGHDGTTLYLSFLQRVSVTNDVFYGFELHRGDGNTNRVLCIGSGVDQTGYGVTSNYNLHITNKNYAAMQGEDTSAHLFVIRFDFGDNNHDHVTVYRDPNSLLDESQCVAVAELQGNFAFDRISLGNFNGTSGKIHEIDEIRLGSSFPAVTGQRTTLDSRMAVALRSRLTTDPVALVAALNSGLLQPDRTQSVSKGKTGGRNVPTYTPTIFVRRW